MGELACVGRKVRYGTCERSGIAVILLFGIRPCDVQFNGVAALFCQRGDIADNRADDFCWREEVTRFFAFPLARDFQNVIHLRQCSLAAFHGGADQFAVGIVQLVHFDQFQRRDQPVKGGAHLVAHRGEECAFGSGMAARFDQSGLHLILSRDLIRDVPDKGNQDRVSAEVVVDSAGKFDREFFSV